MRGWRVPLYDKIYIYSEYGGRVGGGGEQRNHGTSCS